MRALVVLACCLVAAALAGPAVAADEAFAKTRAQVDEANALVDEVLQLWQTGRSALPATSWICLLYTSPSPRDS